MIEVGDWIYLNTRKFKGNAFVIAKGQRELLVHIPFSSVSRVSINSVTKLDDRLGDKDFQILIVLQIWEIKNGLTSWQSDAGRS
ncbi:hypothetical protein [Bacillus haynesii]|uniref:hypothetical protein n=1 Tax=Bacillus haynesii TaxID=1925021 RepID=UPI0035E13AB3